MMAHEFLARGDMLYLLRHALMIVAACVALSSSAETTLRSITNEDYDYYLTGNAEDAKPANRPRSPVSVLIGGGKHLDEAFEWMIRKAGGGDFVVLRATGADHYNQYIYDLGGLDSVETLVIKNRAAASHPFVLERLRRAEAVFISGGDQSNYIKHWKGTPLAEALQQLGARRIPIGGTSAGLAVLGQFDFSALHGTLRSPEALADPYSQVATLDEGFLTAHSLGSVITDSHFVERDRMGRLVSFLARLIADRRIGSSAARAIGIDKETALLVEDGIATRVGKGAVYFLQPPGAPELCQPQDPLVFQNVAVERMSGRGTFDLNSWTASPDATTRYTVSAMAGTLTSSQPDGSVY